MKTMEENITIFHKENNHKKINILAEIEMVKIFEDTH